jgi:membrane protein implicated in regulation of membrane protease activity
MEGRGALWAVVGPLLAFKLASIILLLIYAPTVDGMVWVAITSWYWVLGVILIVAVPFMAWSRLVRVRARREQLRRQEWMLDERAPLPKPESRPNGERQWLPWETGSRGDDTT